MGIARCICKTNAKLTIKTEERVLRKGMREAKNRGAHIGLPKGTRLTTKKSLECKAIIQKHSKDFGGSLEDPDVIKLCCCSRNSYYKYKKEIKSYN